MGLDNGIRLKVKKLNKYNRVWNKPLFVSIVNNDLEFEPLYWRKCWGIRDKILSILGDYYVTYEYPHITKEQFVEIYEAHKRWLDKDTWEAEACSIWSYDDIINTLRSDLCTMSYILKHWDDLEIEKIYFYDSY